MTFPPTSPHLNNKESRLNSHFHLECLTTNQWNTWTISAFTTTRAGKQQKCCRLPQLWLRREVFWALMRRTEIVFAALYTYAAHQEEKHQNRNCFCLLVRYISWSLWSIMLFFPQSFIQCLEHHGLAETDYAFMWNKNLSHESITRSLQIFSSEKATENLQQQL